MEWSCNLKTEFGSESFFSTAQSIPSRVICSACFKSDCWISAWKSSLFFFDETGGDCSPTVYILKSHKEKVTTRRDRGERKRKRLALSCTLQPYFDVREVLWVGCDLLDLRKIYLLPFDRDIGQHEGLSEFARWWNGAGVIALRLGH